MPLTNNGGPVPGTAANTTRNRNAPHYKRHGNKARSHYNKVRQQLTRAEIYDGLLAVGFQYVDDAVNLSPGEYARIPAVGKKASNRGARVRFADDGQIFFWFDWPNGKKGHIQSGGEPITDPVEIARIEKNARLLKEQREADIAKAEENARLQAQRLFNKAFADGDPILAQFPTPPVIENYGLSSLCSSNYNLDTLETYIPVYALESNKSKLVNLQTIKVVDGENRKRFLKGGRTKGGFSCVGDIKSADRVFIGTGWGTCCSLFELTGTPVVVAFSDSNLLAVARLVQERFPDKELIIAGDDDRHKMPNSGRRSAAKAAELSGMELRFPQLCKCCRCSDFNDLMICQRRRAAHV